MIDIALVLSSNDNLNRACDDLSLWLWLWLLLLLLLLYIYPESVPVGSWGWSLPKGVLMLSEGLVPSPSMPKVARLLRAGLLLRGRRIPDGRFWVLSVWLLSVWLRLWWLWLFMVFCMDRIGLDSGDMGGLL